MIFKKDEFQRHSGLFEFGIKPMMAVSLRIHLFNEMLPYAGFENFH